MTDLRGAIEALADAGVRFIVVGGIAGIAHGSPRMTFDLDLVYGRDPRNLERLAATLAPHRPNLRGAPAGRPEDLEAIAELEALRAERRGG